MGRAASRLFDAAATIGYALFGIPMLIIGASIFAGSLFDPLGMLLGGVFALAGGGAVLAAVQTWRRAPTALRGPLLMVAGSVGVAMFMVWAFATRFGP